MFEVVSSLNLLLKPTVLCCLKSSVQHNFFSVTNTTGLCFEAYGGSGLGLGPEKGKMTFFATKTSFMYRREADVFPRHLFMISRSLTLL